MTDYAAARSILEKLIAFDTVSARSNLALIEWVEGYLADHGVHSRRVSNEDGDKANLFASCGPDAEGGVILSGHSDVVPVAGQKWSADPFVLREDKGRLFGRGTSDMKGFIALALAFVPRFVAGSKPVHLAISYDEEVGCKGAPAMIERMRQDIEPPICAIVGEPTSMGIVTGHKGISVHEVRVRGKEAHSSLVDHGVSANRAAVDLMGQLFALADELRAGADPENGFDPAFPTLTIGVMEGGEAANILAGHARFQFDLRCPPGYDAGAILAPFLEGCARQDAALKTLFPSAGVEVEQLADAPPLTDEGSAEAVAFVRRLTGANAAPTKVAYATEGGQFQQAGFPTLICGPGSIEQAHQADEWIAIEQMKAGAAFMTRLAEELA